MTVAEAGLPSAPPDTRAALRRLLLSLADSKRLLGIRYSDWLLGAPSIEAGIAASSMAQDEWGHARLLYAALKDFGEDPTDLEHGRSAAGYTSLESLDGPLADWAEVVVAIVVVDGGLSVALEGILDGGYAPLEGRVGKMLGEEEFHGALGDAWFRRLAGGSDEARGRLADAFRRMTPVVVRAIAPDDPAHRALAESGITDAADVLRSRLADRLSPLAELLGEAVPAALPTDDGWDAGRGRGTGQPEDEAIERAKGERNRALFVE